jgi:hypothetical protein
MRELGICQHCVKRRGFLPTPSPYFRSNCYRQNQPDGFRALREAGIQAKYSCKASLLAAKIPHRGVPRQYLLADASRSAR